MTIVLDASTVVAALIDDGPVGAWAESHLESEALAAPHLILVEAASILRRTVLAGELSDDIASLAHGDLVDMQIDLFPYEPFAERAWELRSNITPYDAWYVALAESLNVPLATLDGRLSRAPGARCSFSMPPNSNDV